MSEALLDRKYEYWQNQLLDLGKRNRMINYRETKRATLKLIEPKFEELFKRVAIDEEELTFQSPIDKISDIRTYSVLSLLESLSCPIPVNIGDIKAEGSILERQKTLKQLRSKSRLALDEQGTNILYMVSGFVEWREKNDASSTWIKSPLILVPVSLVLESINSPYILKKYEDDIVVNPTLSYLFERDYGIVLPSFDPDEESIIEYMDKMEKLVDRKGWRIIRENSIGLVSFLKINMYKDLCNNEEEVKNNPIIRAFAGENSEISNIPLELYNFNHDNTPAMDIYQVVNADSSQQDAILLSRKGISFVMQGPPGTGKSQTITNIIAQGLADGKRILFVSEKAAALEVVHKRLSEVHLDDFCLALHNYKANKKDVLDELGKSLSLNPIKVKTEETAKLTELDTLKEFLGKYVSDIHKEIMPLEMSLYEVYGAIAALEDTIELPLEIENVENMTKDQVNRLGLLVVDFDKAKSNLGDQWYKNPWNGTIIANVTYELSNRIQESLTSILFNMKPFISDMNNLIDGSNQILCLSNMEIYQAFIQKCIECKSVPAQWLGDCNLVSEVERTANDLKKKKSDVLNNRHYLENIFSDGFFMINAEQKATTVSNLKKSVDEILKLEQCQWNQYILEVQEHTTTLKDIINDEISNLSDIRQGIAVVETLKEMFISVPYKVKELLVSSTKIASLQYSEDSVRNIVDDLTLQLQNKDIENKNCEAFQKQIEGVLYDCDELQSEYESVVSFCKDKNCNIDLMDCLDKLNMEQKYKRMLSEQSAKHCSDFGLLYVGENTDWDIVLTQIKNCIQLNDLAEQLKWSKQQCEKIFVYNQGEITLESVLKNTEKLVNLKNECEWICSLFGNDVNFMDSGHDNVKSDMWFLTGVFLMRQSLELGLKSLICRICINKKLIQNAFEDCCHDLSRLFECYYNLGSEIYLNEDEKRWMVNYLASLEEVGIR